MLVGEGSRAVEEPGRDKDGRQKEEEAPSTESRERGGG